MRQEFWKDIRAGDVIYMYGDNGLEIHEATVKAIRDKSETTGSFIMDTDSQEHPTVFVFMNDFEKDGSVRTWDYDTSEQVHISNNYAELVSHYKETLRKKIDSQKALLKNYECLLEKY
jgi:hypothetical protein